MSLLEWNLGYELGSTKHLNLNFINRHVYFSDLCTRVIFVCGPDEIMDWLDWILYII